MWRLINWANKYSERQKEVEEYNRIRERLIEENRRQERSYANIPINPSIISNPPYNEAEVEVDVINPLTPEIRCSNCRHSSDNRSSYVGSIVNCFTCHDHSLFIHISENAPNAPDMSLKAPQMPLELINKVRVDNAIDGLEI